MTASDVQSDHHGHAGPPPGSALDHALRYAALGWHVFPVHSVIINGSTRCTCGKADCERPGKHPIYELVRDGLKSATTNSALIRAWWANAPWANVAVRTGEVSGIFAIDVDVKEGASGHESLDALRREHGRLPDTVEALTGGGGTHLVFRYPPGVAIGTGTSRLGPGIDIRGDGGYIVVAPSRHFSGQSYLWEGSSDPLEGVEPADAPTWLIERLAQRQENPSQCAGNGPPLDTRQVLELRQAMGYLDHDDYETWVRVGMCLQASGAGEQAFGLWNEWSQLSETKYDPSGMRRKWASFKDRADGLGPSSLFAMAQEKGWVNPASREALAFESATGMSVAEANRRAPNLVVVDEAAPQARRFPVPGLDEVAAWIDALAEISYPVVTQQAVLALVSAATSRLYTTPQGDPLSLYLGCCGRSVGELRYTHHAVSMAMSGAGLRRMVRGTRMTSPATIYKTLLRSPSCLYLSDDYGGVAAFSKRQPSGLQEHALSLIAGLYDGKTVQLDGPEDAGFRPGSGQVSDEQPVIHAPCLSILALIGLDQLAVLMRQSETGRGALQQMLIGIGDERTAVERDPGDIAPPAWLRGHLCRLRRVPNSALGADLNLADIFSNITGLVPAQTVVRFAAPLSGIYEALDALSEDRRARSLLLAARGIVRRLAGGLAAWGNPDDPVVTRDILEWAGTYVIDRLRETVEQFAILHSQDGRSSVYDQVLAKVLEARTSGMSNRDLIIGCWGFRNLSSEKRGDLVGQMLADNVIVEVDTLNPKTKRHNRVYVAARFVCEERS